MASYFQNNRDIDSPDDNRFNHLINKLRTLHLTLIEQRASPLSISVQKNVSTKKTPSDNFVHSIGVLVGHNVWLIYEISSRIALDRVSSCRLSIFSNASKKCGKIIFRVCPEYNELPLNADRLSLCRRTFHRLSIKSTPASRLLTFHVILLVRLAAVVIIVRGSIKTTMDSGNHYRKNVEMYRRENIENFPTTPAPDTYQHHHQSARDVTRSATSDDIDTKFLRQGPKAATRTSTDDLYRVDSRSRAARSCSPLQHGASVRRRFSSSFDRAGRSATNRQTDSFDDTGAATTAPGELDYTSTTNFARSAAKERSHDDKENESPKIVDLLNSPKMKVSDNALAEQNSPRRFDSSKTTTATNRFTFSPRHIFAGDEYPGSAVVAEHALTATGSPLISSAVYKHGNYFRFPDVDCITPDNVGGSIESASTKLRSSAANEPPGGLKSQTSRRVRLKSISLDSDGARLVEDNLGVPVEELMEYTTAQTEPAPVSASEPPPDTGPANTNKHLQTLTVPAKSCRKNKNNLKINIDSGVDSSTKSDRSTPKTPTLTQTKQKAVSLDSSDANSMAGYCCTTSSTSAARKSHQPLGSRSTHHVSSISVPSTPKRNSALSRKKVCYGVGKSKVDRKPMPAIAFRQHHTPVSESDCRRLDQMLMSDDDRSMRIAIDIDDNYGECAVDEMDDVHIENFYMGEIEDEVVVLTGLGGDVKKRVGAKATTTATDSCDYMLLGSNLPAQKFGMLSLSNNNLETLPESMTLTDFECPTTRDETQTIVTISAHEVREDVAKRGIGDDTKESAAKPAPIRGNILQRRGSNQSLTINLNGSLGNLTKHMSASNYSLGSFTGSNHNLNTCPQHLLTMMQSSASSTQSVLMHGYGSSQTNILQPNTSPVQQQNSFETDAGSSEVGVGTKKNLLQRRGSNTSLTLNIKGSSHANLSRFSSHSSLNISSAHTTSGKFKHGYHLSQQQPIAGAGSGGSSAAIQPHHQQPYHQLVRQQPVSKKGLLERRNSNASLTLNIHNSGLSSSSYNLRASACSLNNIPNMSIECYEQGVTTASTLDQGSCDIESSDAASTGLATTREQRKYLSSDNLNTMLSQCNKLNQTHVRNSTKTCFGSVSDLKPNMTSSGSMSEVTTEISPSTARYDDNNADSLVSDIAGVGTRGFEQSNLCSCTGVRNITTKPLSPQSTSEDFKMYLANIQLLQNATNVLTEEHLRKLHYIFKRGYEIQQQQIASSDSIGATGRAFFADVSAQLSRAKSRNPFQRQTCQHPGQESDEHQFHFNNALPPNDDEKRHLLRSLHEEFWDLPTNHQEKPLVFGSQSKNRYKTILPNEHSRVLLEAETDSLVEPYINANYIKGPDYAKNSFIVTQGPLPNTIYDYWLMVYQNIDRYQRRAATTTMTTTSEQPSPSSQKMIMLTNFIESNQQKCSIYFPIEVNDTIFITSTNEKFANDRLAAFYMEHVRRSPRTGPIEIEISNSKRDDGGEVTRIQVDDIPKKNYFLIVNSGLHARNGFSIRKFDCLYVVTKLDDAPSGAVRQCLVRFTCYHYWFPDWPDHHSPEDVGLLLDMGMHLLDMCCEQEFDSRPLVEDDDDEIVPTSVLDAIVQMTGDDIEPMPIIHCSAGIGRTGCLAAILNGVRQIRSSIRGALKPWNYQLTGESIEAVRSAKNLVNVDILGIVCNLRLQRGGMVQNSEQYELIHRALCLYQTRIDAELLSWTDREGGGGGGGGTTTTIATTAPGQVAD